MYWEQKVSIEEADRVLKYAMGDFKVDAASSVAINTGVKLGGPNAWSENALLKAKGEKRILKKYPDDPTMTWAIWKEQPGSL
ncbi:hypothetical protein SAMN05518669_11018 [Variovorax sp. YR634]|nr:hypothetical protein SAMN05518669_11018 [Variovorax sp. YR634]